VMQIADRFGHKVIDVAGFSWGGALAQQIAIQFPGRVRRLVLMATTPVMGGPGIGWAAMFDDDMLASGLKIQTATPLGIAYQSAAMAGWSSIGFLSGLKQLPTLVLMGEQDGVMPACYGEMLADQIDGAVLEMVPGSHLFPFTHAAAISARISAFLDQPAAGQQAAARGNRRSLSRSHRAPPPSADGRYPAASRPRTLRYVR